MIGYVRFFEVVELKLLPCESLCKKEAPLLDPDLVKDETFDATPVATLFLRVLSNTAMSKYSLYRTIYAP